MSKNSLRSMTLKRALPAASSMVAPLYLRVIDEQPRQVQQRRKPAHDADHVKGLQPEHAGAPVRCRAGHCLQLAHHQRAAARRRDPARALSAAM